MTDCKTLGLLSAVVLVLASDYIKGFGKNGGKEGTSQEDQYLSPEVGFFMLLIMAWVPLAAPGSLVRYDFHVVFVYVDTNV